MEEEMATHSSILAWENPMNKGAWWATVLGVAKSRTQLKRLSSRLYRLYSLFWSLLVAVDGQETGE